MWNRIERILICFRKEFSRIAAFKWFCAIVTGLALRTDQLGVTSVMRDLAIAGKHYESMLHFFRASSWNLHRLRVCWYTVVRDLMPLYRPYSRVVLVGDGTKNSKEGRFMPGVKRLAQESETQSKPEYIHGHMWGGIGVLIGCTRRFFCLPLSLRIHDGLQAASDWTGRGVVSHVVQILRDGCLAAQHLGHAAHLLLDRYFLSVPALVELNRLNAGNPHRVDIITKAKRSAVAYEEPPVRIPGQRGRSRKKGAKVKLSDLFETHADLFRTQKMELYGKKQKIRYYQIDLLWGQGLYQKLRFVLTECGKTRSILVSTDLSLSALAVIELYGRRFRIERMFRELKQQIGAFAYHFWTKALPKLNHFKSKKDPDPLSLVTEAHDRERVLLTIRATEMFALLSSIAMGILQSLSLDFANGVFKESLRYQRTPAGRCPSEANMMVCLRQHIFSLLHFHRQNLIPQLILSLQMSPDEDILPLSA